jgi:DNA-binding NtrC family response regulator
VDHSNDDRPHQDPALFEPSPHHTPANATPGEIGVSVRLDRPFHELKQQLMAEFESAYVRYCLEESAMNVSRASRASGLSRKHLRTLMAKYGLVVRRELASSDGTP